MPKPEVFNLWAMTHYQAMMLLKGLLVLLVHDSGRKPGSHEDVDRLYLTISFQNKAVSKSR